MSFLKSFWKFIQKMQSFVGTLLFLILMLIFTAFIFGDLLFDSAGEKTKAENSALVLDLRGAIVEQLTFSNDPYEQLLAGDIGSNTLLRDVVRAIDLAAEDDNISMLVLNFSNFSGAYPSKLHYIGRKIEEFKESGKNVVSYGSLYDQSAYLLASFSDEIYMHPQGAALLYGYGGYQSYFLGLLEKIKAEVQLFRVGKYKAAMEPFIRSDMSEEARVANLELYGGLWDDFIADVAAQREIEEDVIRQGVENADQLLLNLNGDLGQLALQNSLIDGLMTREQWVEYMQEKVGKGQQDKRINQINLRDYLASNFQFPTPRQGNNLVAIVYANGTVMDGDMPQGTIGGDTLSRQLREARLDENVKAVVLRVETPGGSAFASELIRQEVLLLKKAGKPVIASMGGVAASGGYWISANADEIWANPTTITGSIGIFGAIPNIEGTLAEIGITTDGVGTTPLISAGINKPLPEELGNIIQSNIENGYQRFLEIVAEGRNMNIEQVNEIAQGRVWSGRKALEIGLVDKLGNIDQAIELLRKAGAMKAAKKADRIAAEGVISAKIAEDGSYGILVEINTETDFVARNTDFIALGEELCQDVLENNYTEIVPALGAKVELLITKIKENMSLKRFDVWNVSDSMLVSEYVHGEGTLAAMVAIQSSDKAVLTHESVVTLGNDLALHVAAFTPLYLDKSNVDEAYVKENTEIFTTQTLALGKPEKVVPGIVAGKLNKHFTEICFMQQAFVKDDSISVEKALANVSKEVGATLSIANYSLYKVGVDA